MNEIILMVGQFHRGDGISKPWSTISGYRIRYLSFLLQSRGCVRTKFAIQGTSRKRSVRRPRQRKPNPELRIRTEISIHLDIR